LEYLCPIYPKSYLFLQISPVSLLLIHLCTCLRITAFRVSINLSHSLFVLYTNFSPLQTSNVSHRADFHVHFTSLFSSLYACPIPCLNRPGKSSAWLFNTLLRTFRTCIVKYASSIHTPTCINTMFPSAIHFGPAMAAKMPKLAFAATALHIKVAPNPRSSDMTVPVKALVTEYPFLIWASERVSPGSL